MSELTDLLHELEEQYTQRQAELAAKQADVENLRVQIQLLEQLIALRDGQNALREGPFPRSGPTPTKAGRLSELVHGVLDAHRKPMHISAIREALIAQGHSIPGRGTDANVIAHISRDDSIVRVGKGTYALGSWGLPVRPKRKRRAKTRNRKTSQGAR